MEDCPTSGDHVTVHYVGSLATTTEVFDSSRAKGQPFAFTLGTNSVIKGWEHGIPKMSLGQRATLRIDAVAAYDTRGCVDKSAHGTGEIPAGANLIFDVEVLDINGRRSLARFLATLNEWSRSKLAKYDSDAEARASADAKHGSREAYEAHIQKLLRDKYEAERRKKGPRAPSIEESAQALVARTADALITRAAVTTEAPAEVAPMS